MRHAVLAFGLLACWIRVRICRVVVGESVNQEWIELVEAVAGYVLDAFSWDTKRMGILSRRQRAQCERTKSTE